jgi:small subunit ribosomal protein S16
MLKLRLKKIGRKRQPAYRLVVMKSSTRRDGRPLDQVGYYNSITKQSYFDPIKITKWLNYGVKPTETVYQLLKKANIIQD